MCIRRKQNRRFAIPAGGFYQIDMWRENAPTAVLLQEVMNATRAVVSILSPER